ncbi:MAG: PAS domain S-box protein, partial [Chloroflexi bacterium]|nr:PAS domain S-box protein [Chloroflexota bacterium]
ERTWPADAIALLRIVSEVFTNALQRQQVETALHESEAKYRTLFEDLGVPITIYSPDGTILMANQIAANIFGTSRARLVGRRLHEVFPPDIIAIYQQRIDQIARSGQGAVYEDEVELPSGEKRWYLAHAQPVTDVAGQVLSVQLVGHDITDLKHAERKLRASEHKFRSIVEESLDGIRLTDEQGRITEWNQGCEQITGVSREKALGRPAWDVLFALVPDDIRTEERYARIKERTQRLLQTGENVWQQTGPTTHTIQQPDGTQRMIESSVFPIKTEQGWMACGIIHDVTVLMQAQEALMISEDRYRRAISAGHVGVWEWDVATSDLYLAPELTAMLGYADRELPNGPAALARLIHPDDVGRVLNEIRNHLHYGADAEAYEIELRFHHRDGSQRWMSLRGSLLRDPDGQVQQMVGTVTDITDTRTMIAALRRRDAILEAVSMVAERLLQSTDWQPTILPLLQTLGVAAGVPYAMLGQPESAGGLVAAWQEPGVAPLAGGWPPVAVLDRPGVRHTPHGPELSVWVHDQFWGLVRFWGPDTTRDWATAEIEALQIAADMLGAVIERQQARDDLHRYAERLRLLREIDQAILSAVSPEAIATAALEHIRALVPCKRASVLVLEPEHDAGRVLAAFSAYETRVGIGYTMSMAESRRVFPALWRGESQFVRDITEISSELPVAAMLRAEGIQSYINVPLMVRGQLIGALSLGADVVHAFTADHLEVAEEVADQLSIAIHQARLHVAERQRRLVAETLGHAATIIGSTLELAEVLDRILEQLSAVIDFDSASVQRKYDNQLEIMACRGFDQPHNVIGLQFPIQAKFPNMRVVTDQQPLALDDITQDYPHFQDEATDYTSGHIRSWLGVPLLLRNRVIGMIALDRGDVRPFVEDDIELAVAFASQASIAIENARLYEQAQARAAELESLLAISSELSSTLDLDALLGLVIDQALTLLAADEGSIMRLDDDGLIRPVMARGPYAAQVMQHVLRPGEGLTGVALADNQPLLANFANRDPRAVAIGDIDLSEDNHILLVPLTMQARTIGAMVVNRKHKPFQADDLRLFAGFAHQAAIAIENARLYDEAQDRAEELQSLLEVSRDLSSTLDLQALLTLVMEQALALLGAEVGVVMRLEDDGQTVRPLMAISPDADLLMQTTVRVDEGLIGVALASGEPLLVNFANRDPRATIRGRATRDQDTHVMVVPLMVHGRTSGVMVVNRHVPEFTEVHLRLFAGFAHQAAIALENARLYEQVQQHAAELEQRVDERTRELQQEKEQVEAILAGAADAIIIASADGTILSVNPAFERQLGYTSDEAIGARVTPNNIADRGEAFMTLWAAAQTGQPARAEMRLRRKDGTFYDADLNMAPIFQPEGGVHAYVVVIRDISAQKEIERMKDEFVSNVSHELRTPITNLRLREHLLAAQPERLATHLDVIQRETNRLETLIEDLLALSRLDQERVTLAFAPTDLNTLVTEYVTDRQPLAQQKALTLRYEVAPELPPVRADRGLVGQVLSILLTNALNYTPAGGEVVVRTQVQPAANHAGEGAREAGFAVLDTGPGIPREEQPRLFTRFFRGEAAHELGISGTGLGLAIAHEIIERHAGRITVHSTGMPGDGTIFEVWLPVMAEGKDMR